MRPFVVGTLALGVWATAAVLPAPAAWDNVFQPTLFHRNRAPAVSRYYVAPAVVASSPVVALTPTCNTCNSAPQPQQQTACSTSYVQRCYYQPVTTYTTKTYYEPVTTYRTSYYYEPVTTYRYSCYYDPCTCTTQKVATPVCSYQLRAQSCPVQSWVQRCCQVPVQSYQKVCYWQPRTTCCTTTEGAPIYAPTSAPAGVAVPTFPATTPPAVTGAPAPAPSAPPVINTTPPPSGTPPQVEGAPSITNVPPANSTPGAGSNQTPNNGSNSMYERYYPPQQPINRQMPPASLRTSPGATPPPPAVKLDRIVVGPDAHVDGQVVRADNSPRPNAKVLFVNAALGQRQTIYANTAGRFSVDLPPGSWLVYLHGSDGIPMYHSRLDVNPSRTAPVTLVNR